MQVRDSSPTIQVRQQVWQDEGRASSKERMGAIREIALPRGPAGEYIYPASKRASGKEYLVHLALNQIYISQLSFQTPFVN